jgi:hypothetical protein
MQLLLPWSFQVSTISVMATVDANQNAYQHLPAKPCQVQKPITATVESHVTTLLNRLPLLRT